nr:hypothetical protein [uncultured Lachnoclostridium sp.]
MPRANPASDLKNKFPEIASLADNVERKLDEDDKTAKTTEERLSHDDVFRNVRSVIYGR